jgi:hypothetical protein
MQYLYLGHALGGRADGGDLSYREMAETAVFRKGVKELLAAASRTRLAIMCSEHEPCECHRFLLISPVLKAAGVNVAHILRDGGEECQEETEVRLMSLNGLGPDLLSGREEPLIAAFERQEQRLHRRK